MAYKLLSNCLISIVTSLSDMKIIGHVSYLTVIKIVCNVYLVARFIDIVVDRS